MDATKSIKYLTSCCRMQLSIEILFYQLSEKEHQNSTVKQRFVSSETGDQLIDRILILEEEIRQTRDYTSRLEDKVRNYLNVVLF